MLHWNEADSVTTFLSLPCSYFDDLIMLNLSMSMLRCCNWIVLYKSCACCVFHEPHQWSSGLAPSLDWLGRSFGDLTTEGAECVNWTSRWSTGSPARGQETLGVRAAAVVVLELCSWTGEHWVVFRRVQLWVLLCSGQVSQWHSLTSQPNDFRRVSNNCHFIPNSSQHTVLQENTVFTSVEYISFVVICEIYLQFLSETFKSCNSFLVWLV